MFPPNNNILCRRRKLCFSQYVNESECSIDMQTIIRLKYITLNLILSDWERKQLLSVTVSEHLKYLCRFNILRTEDAKQRHKENMNLSVTLYGNRVHRRDTRIRRSLLEHSSCLHFERLFNHNFPIQFDLITQIQSQSRQHFYSRNSLLEFCL